MFGGRVFQLTIGIPKEPTVLLFFPSLCNYAYKADFIQELLNIISRSDSYIDGVLSLNNSTFGDSFERTNPMELDEKDTTESSAPDI